MSGRPLIFVQTWGAESASLKAFDETLGEDQPLVGLGPPEGDGPLPTSVEEWVDHALAQLRGDPMLQPPYLLAGYSFGGVVALELARRLQADGDEIAWLGLLGTVRPRRNPKGAGPYLRYHWQEVRHLPHLSGRARYIAKRFRGGAKRALPRLADAGRRRLGIESGDRRLGQDFPPLRRAIFRAYLSYVPQRYVGRVHLFTTADDRRFTEGDPTLGWGPYVTDLVLTPVAGRHATLFDPESLGPLVRALRARLADGS